MDRETVVTHLQIIHTWASFARERDLQFFTAKHLEDIAQWTDDAIFLLKEQAKQYRKLLKRTGGYKMNGRQAARAAAKRIEELEYVNAGQTADIKDYNACIQDIIYGGDVCKWCE